MDNIQISNTEIVGYLPLVKKIAYRLFMGLPKNIEFDDMVSSGILGLWEAFKDFDPQKRVKFSTYAFYRIRGAMLDALRQLDWLPRSQREKIKNLESAVVELENKLGRAAYPEELADYLKVDIKEVNSLLFKAQQSEVVFLEEELQKGLASQEDYSLFIDELQTKEMIELFAEAIKGLSEKEGLVISLYYYEGLNLKEIAKVLDLSESRISQLLSKAVASLRKKMQYVKVEI